MAASSQNQSGRIGGRLLLLLLPLALAGGAKRASGEPSPVDSPLRVLTTDRVLSVEEALVELKRPGVQTARFDELTNLGLAFGRKTWIFGDLDERWSADHPYLHLSWSDAVEASIFFLEDGTAPALEMDLTQANVPGLGAVVPLLASGKRARFFVAKIQAEKTLVLTPAFATVADVLLTNQKQQLPKIILIFFIMICSLIGYLVYLVTKFRVAAFFGFYSSGMSLLLLEYSGIGRSMIWQKGSYLDDVMFPFVHYATAHAAYYFLKDFLGTAEKSKRGHQALNFMTGYSAVGGVASLIWPHAMTASVPLLGIFSTTAILVALFGVYKTINFSTRIYLVSWLLFTFFVVLYMASMAGFTGDYFLFGYELAVGTAIDMCVLVAAIYLKIQTILRERESERQSARRKLEQTSRLTSLGKMAAGIAHEINNPLSVIRAAASNIQFIKEQKIHSPEIEQKALEDILNTADRIAKIVSSLGILVRQRRDVLKETVSAHDLVFIALSIGRHKMENLKIDVDVQVDPPDLAVRCDKVQISQVILNLVVNAVDAIGGKAGWIKIRVERRGSAAFIEVTNSGPLIPEEHVHHIFEPFYTTKEVGEGMGLGLSIAKAVVDANGGEMYLATDRENTTFAMSLEAA